MQIIRFFWLIAGCFVCSFCFAQEPNKERQRALSVGDTVPDIILEQMINYSDSTLALSDFEGKAILFDFWATWCVPCIAAFPKLDDIQRKYKDGMQIILLSKDNPERINNFYSKKSDLTLPTSCYGSGELLDTLFPHREIPHCVWIGKDRKVYAITDGSQVSEVTIANFLNDQPQTLTTRDDSYLTTSFIGSIVDSIEQVAGIINTVSLATNVVYESKISKYDPRLTHTMALGREGKEYRHRFLEMQNVSVVHMMQWALGYTSSKDYWEFYIDLNDTTLTYPSSNYKEWERNHSYSYRLVLSKPDSALRFEIMKRDLDMVFGLRAYRKELEVPALVLRKVDGASTPITSYNDSTFSSSSIYHITLVNRPVESLSNILNHYRVGNNFKLPQQIRLPLLNETGIDSNIDLYIENTNIRDFEALNQALIRQGLRLGVEVVKMEVIVISDKIHPDQQ